MADTLPWLLVDGLRVEGEKVREGRLELFREVLEHGLVLKFVRKERFLEDGHV